jgi:hypothetical protein
MKKIIFITTIIFCFNTVPALAIPNPWNSRCILYGGNLDKETKATICHLKTGEKCDPEDKGFNFENIFIEPCNKYAIMPCSELGKSVSYNKCCDGLSPAREKSGFNKDCKEILSTGGMNSVCIKCGDRKCDEKYESICNCPQDCQKNIWAKFIAWLKNFFT